MTCVRNIAEAEQVLEKAAESGETATLEPAEGMEKYAGLLYVREMFNIAIGHYPQVPVTQVFNAGDDAALAVVAMKDRFDRVRYHGSDAMTEKLQDIAQQLGKELVE